MSTGDADKRKSRIPLVAAVYLLTVLVFGWGFAVARYQVFPWFWIESIESDVLAFIEGGQDDDTTIVERLQNDLNIVPERQIREFKPSDPGRFSELDIGGLRARRDPPRISISAAAPRSYRILAGAFDFETAMWGAVLLDPEGKVRHTWQMNGELAELNDSSDATKNMYGLGFFPDGSAAFTMQEALGGLVKIDVCSNLEWAKPGQFHHVAEPTEDASAFWTFGGKQHDLHPTLLLIDAQTGETIREIDMADVEQANTDIPIFQLARRSSDENATHPNDIEPLPSSLADANPLFAAGDLLLSYNTTNLVFVIDPESYQIKWWYVGAGDGPHDPDWHDNGLITLFNNNYRAGRRNSPKFSTIVEIDPAAHTHRVIVDGSEYDFYSNYNGHHIKSPDNTAIITSSTQGRAFEVDLETGETVFEFINAYDWDDGQTLHLAESYLVTEELARQWMAQDCTQR